MHIGKHPYTFCLLALLVGIFLCPYISISWVPLSVVLISILLLLRVIAFKIQFRTAFSVLFLIFWVLLGLILVDINTDIPKDHYLHFEEKDKVQYASVILEEQNNSNEKNRKYTARVTEISYKNRLIPTSGKILLLLDKSKYDSVLVLGNEYKLLLKVQKIFPALNPHQFDYAKYLERNYILRLGIVDTILSQKTHTSFWYQIKNSNQRLIQKVNQSVLSPDSKEFLTAFLLGDRSEMKKDNIQAYSKAGIMHLIAISGMHITFIFGIVFSILSFFLGRKNRKLIIISSLIFVWLFGCFVGLSSSVSRSCLMITIYYGFELLKRSSSIYHSLSLSAILILLYNPYEIYSIGFQLSYVAVFFMSWLSSPLTSCFAVKNKRAREWIIQPLSITIVAQLGTMPFVLYYFHQFSLLSIPANILIIPYTAVITYSSIIELGIVFLPDNFQLYFSLFYDFLVKILIKGTYGVSSINFFLFRCISLSLLELIFLVSALVLLRYFLIKPNKLKNTFPFLICLVVFQLSRLVNDYSSSKKENLIVFSNRYALVGFREGQSLLILKDEKDDLGKLNPFIIEPYITGERIKQVEYKNMDYQKLYNWRSSKLQILNKENNEVSDSANYLVIAGNPEIIPKESVVSIVFIGNIYSNYPEKIENTKSKIWTTKDKGAFIAAP